MIQNIWWVTRFTLVVVTLFKFSPDNQQEDNIVMEIYVFEKWNAQDEDGEMVEGLDGLDTQELSVCSTDDGDHLLFGDLSHMHRGKRVVGVNNKSATQHYSMCSAKVVWGL